MRTLLYLLLAIIVLGTASAGPRQRFKKRLGRIEKKRNAIGKDTQQRKRGILKRLDTVDNHVVSLGVQIADMLANKKLINSHLSNIKNDNLDRHEKMDKAFYTMDEKMDEMNQDIASLGLLMDNLVKSMVYMNDTIQNMQRDIKTSIAEGLRVPGNRGKVARIAKPNWISLGNLSYLTLLW